MATYIKISKQDYLEHHGILGQKWGVRNGPPYPLKPGDHSKAEKRHMSAPERIVRNQIYTTKQMFTHPVKTTKEIIKHPITTSAEYHFVKYVKDDIEYRKAKKAQESSGGAERSSSGGESVDTKSTSYFVKSKIKDINDSGFKVKESASDITADAAAINPHYNPKALSAKYSMNCTHCVMAYAARRMGMDVEAKPNKYGRNTEEFNLYFEDCLDSKHTKNIEFNRYSDNAQSVRTGIEKACKELSGKDDAAVGFIRVQGPYIGHVFSWEKTPSGKVMFVDAQSNDVDNKHITDMFEQISKGKYLDTAVMITRLDNCNVDTKVLHAAVQDTKERK